MKAIDSVRGELLGDFLFRSNFYKNIIPSEREPFAGFGPMAKICGCLILIVVALASVIVAIEWKNGGDIFPSTIGVFIKLALVMTLMISLFGFSSSGLIDAFGHGKQLKNPWFYLTILAEGGFTFFLIWLQISGVIEKRSGIDLIGQIQIWVWFAFGMAPLLAAGYRYVNASDLWMFIKIIWQTFKIWLTSAYRPYVYRYCPEYQKITSKRLEGWKTRELQSLKHNILDAIRGLDFYSSFGFAILWTFGLSSIVFGVTVKHIYDLLEIGITRLSAYANVPQLPFLLWEIVVVASIISAIAFSAVLVARKALLVILEQIEIYENGLNAKTLGSDSAK